jgi:GT2 family glycosyltransferase
MRRLGAGGDPLHDLLPPAGRRKARPDFAVCVPARDEARRLPELLAALAMQRDLEREPVLVVLALNNCRDGSREAAERAAAVWPRLRLRVVEVELPPEASHAGAARRLAMESGAAELPPDGAVLTTDADARPAPDWIARSLDALAAGADVVGARLIGRRDEEARFPPALRVATAEMARLRRALIGVEDALDPDPLDPAPRHGDASGGGLALTLEAYRRAGGCPPARFREDLALVAAVRRLGGALRRPPEARVEVSARLRGRAAGGMADTIRAWDERLAAGLPLEAPDPRAAAAFWRRRAQARRAAAAEAAGLPPGLAARRIAAVVARRAPDPWDWPTSPLPEALRAVDDIRRRHALRAA